MASWSIAEGLQKNRPGCSARASPFQQNCLGGVDKFEPVSGGGKMDHSEEAVGQLIIPGGDGAVDLELSEHALDAVALLVERPIMLDFHTAI